jgi:hypothetical protein
MAVNNYKKILDLYSDSASNEEVVNRLLAIKSQTEDKDFSDLIGQTVSGLLTQNQMSGCRLSAMCSLGKCNLSSARELQNYCDRVGSKEEWQVLCERNGWNPPSTSCCQWQIMACSKGYCPAK